MGAGQLVFVGVLGMVVFGLFEARSACECVDVLYNLVDLV